MTNGKTRKIIKYVAPTVLSQICFFLFTIIDGIFVGRGVGTEALAAVNMAFPYVMLANALFLLINVGGVSIAAIKLGKGDKGGAGRVFHLSTAMLLIVSLLLSIAGVFFTDSICKLLGANETYFSFVHDYLFWYSLFIIPSGLSMGLQSYGRNDNVPQLVGIAVIVSTLFNVFCDWLLVFAIPMGTKGAAIATGMSQTIALMILLPHYLLKKGVFHFHLPQFDSRLARDIIIHGLPAGIGQLSPSVMTLCMNSVLIAGIGNIGVNAFSIISYVASFTVAIFNGTSDGLQPLFGQSYGAKKMSDLKFYFKSGIMINFIGSVIVAAILPVIGRPVCILFGADSVTLEYVLEVMPFYSWGFIVMAFNMMIVAFLYATDESLLAILISALRGIVLNAIVIFGVPAIWGKDTIWFTMGIYEAITLIIAIALLKCSRKKKNYEQKK